MKRVVKFLVTVSMAVMITLSLTSCWWLRNPNPEGIPDPLGSWGNINQLIERPADWRQIVQNKQFALGAAETVPIYYNKDYSYAYYRQSYGTFPAIDGSTVLLPMAAEFGWQFLDLSDANTTTFYNFSTTHGAYQKLIGTHSYSNTVSGEIMNRANGFDNYYEFEKERPDIIFATPPSVDELAMAASVGVALKIEPICYDSFVFITHRDNPVESLTAEQVQKIYSGEITNWNEVGGEDLVIQAYQREENSGSQTAMEEMVMKGINMTEPPLAKVVVGMGALIDVVAGYENDTMSLGYTYKYYVDRLYKSSDIKVLKINGVAPSDDNVRNNVYPFAATYNAVIRSDDYNKNAGNFFRWMLSIEGQQCIAQAGYTTLVATA